MSEEFDDIILSELNDDERMDARPEELDFDDWIELTKDFVKFGEE